MKLLKLDRYLLAAGMFALGALAPVSATERFFTYTYEPETMPQGLFEYEQWVTARVGRNSTVGQEKYNRWDFRHEFEYGVTDNYTLALYVNESLTNFKETGTGRNVSHFQFDGISLENRYMVLNPAEHRVGLALYLEPRISGSEAEFEQKIILGQRCGNWKWALNLTHATEWAEDFKETEGEVEVSFGITRELNKNWSLGIEARDHNELPEYDIWENTAFYLGPVINYRRDRWWATLSIMPQIVGANFADNADGDHHFELEGHERLNIRLIAGFTF
jgi:hypothetical protein